MYNSLFKNAPKLLSTVGTLIKAALTHLFSLFVSFNIFDSIGTIFISIFYIIFSNSLQSLNISFIILFSLYSSKYLGILILII